jgi:glycosyltransferase involved in cell wall biosynthesis
MRIGFDISQTGKMKAGCGFFADGLIRNLAKIDEQNEYFLYPTFGDHFWDPEWRTATVKIHHPKFHSLAAHASFQSAKLFWNHPSTDLETRLGRPDLIHSNNFFCPTGLRNVHLIYTLYDLSFLTHPEWTSEENRIGCFQGVFNASLYADWIISISQYSRNHFLEIFPHYPSDRIVVVHPASRFFKSREIQQPKRIADLQPNRFWLNVGVLEPRKNHRGLLRAYSLLKRDIGGTFPLVLAGGKGWLIEDFEKEIDSFDLRPDVISLGYVDDETLRWLYQSCFAFVYPSFFEGFGLPVLEAMTLGAPVITSNVSSLPEIVGDAGILIDPFHEQELFQAMRRLVEDAPYRIEMQEKGLRRSAQFSWSTTASQVLELYQKTQKPGATTRSLPEGT